jgi:hypothetical protein
MKTLNVEEARDEGYEVKRNPITRLWHLMDADSDVIDWRGTGFPTRKAALEHLTGQMEYEAEREWAYADHTAIY